jgi:hypothetical protein
MLFNDPHTPRRINLYRSKSRIWVHWLLWIFVPFGGVISGLKTKMGISTTLSILSVLSIVMAPKVTADYSNEVQIYEQTGKKGSYLREHSEGDKLQNPGEILFFMLVVVPNLLNLVGATFTSMYILNARSILGIEDAVEAQKLLERERNKV